MSVIDVRRERDIVLTPSLSSGTAKEVDERPDSPPADLDEGKTIIDCGRDRGCEWSLEDEGREVGLAILDGVVLDIGFRCGSTAGGINLDEVGGLSMAEGWKDV